MTVSRIIRILGRRFRSLRKRGELDRELDQELAFHFEQLVSENTAEGMSPSEARWAARRALGNIALLEDECRDQRRTAWLHDLAQDVMYGLRMLRKNPGFTVLATVSLALGIGGNAAIFGVVNAVWEGGLSLPNADRLVAIRTFPVDNPQELTQASVPDYMGWKDQSGAFESMGASIADHGDLGSEGNGTPVERIDGQGFTPQLFKALGVQPMLGRVFTEEEDPIDNPARVMVLSYRLWQRRFAGDPNVLNTTVRLNGIPTTIIGVMPASFWYPVEEAEYWVPLGLNRFQLQGSARFFMVTARLKPRMSVARAQADMDAIAAHLSHEFPNLQGWGVRVQTVHDYLLGWTRDPLATLAAAVSLVLLIACANVATLLLARGSARTSEIAMRVALGASRGRIVRQLLTESVLLSLLGGLTGILVAEWGLRGLIALSPPPGAMRIGEIGLNPQVLGITILFATLAGLACGLGPAFTGFRLGAGQNYSRHGLRGVLVAAQIAVALVLLIGSGLLMNSLIRLAGNDLNFNPERLLTFSYRIPVRQYLHNLGSFHGAPYAEVNPPPYLTMQRVMDRLNGIQGAEAVAGISHRPVNSLVLATMSFSIEGQPALENESDRAALSAVYFLVTPNFFTSMKTPIVRGRDFSATDTASGQWVVVINETMAQHFWPGQDPIGKRLTLDAVSGEQPREVIGVIRDIPLRRTYEPRPVIYASYLQQAAHYRGPNANIFGEMTFLIRGAGEPMNLAPAARKAIAEIDPDSPIASITTMDEFLGGQIRNRGHYALLLGTFAFVATVLAAIGIYGVMAYTVAQRTREIGVRRALGASATEIVQSVGGQALVLIAAGLLVGLAGSFAFTRLIASQLWAVTPTDPATFAGVTVLLGFVALLACFVPGRRALRVDPTVALRSE